MFYKYQFLDIYKIEINKNCLFQQCGLNYVFVYKNNSSDRQNR